MCPFPELNMQYWISTLFPLLPFHMIFINKTLKQLQLILRVFHKLFGLDQNKITYQVTITLILKQGESYLRSMLSLIAATEPVIPISKLYYLVIQVQHWLYILFIISEIIIIIRKEYYFMIHTFSPNWYKPQCLFFDQNNLYFASNYVLYRYNLDVRRVQADKCFRKIAMKSGMNSKDIKIHTIKKLTEHSLIIGTNQSDAVIVNSSNLDVLSIVRNIGLKSTYLCYTGIYETKASYALFTDQNGGLTKVFIQNPNEYKVELMDNQALPKQKVKQILNISNMGLIIYGKGHMILLDDKFDKIIEQVSPSKIGLQQQSVLSIDTFQDGPVLWACMLTRNKHNDIFIHFWSIVVNKENEKYELVFKNIIKSEIKTIYPKVMSEKIKNVQKAALTIKFIDQSHLVLTGKLGQIFILNLLSLPEVVTIKPQSIDDLPSYVQILNDSKHYKQIYSIYVHHRPKSKFNQLFTISTDQTMSAWKIADSSIQNIYNIKFITSEVASIFYSEADPKTVFFLLKDSNIRSATPLSTQNYFLNEYWKFTKKFRILKAVMHMQEPGVCAMVTDCGKVLVYDLLDDRMMKQFDLQAKGPNEQIINISFEYKTILDPIHKLIQQLQPDIENEWKQQKIKCNAYHTKEIKNNAQIGILVQQKNRLRFICQGENDYETVVSIKRILRIERVHNTKLWDQNSLLFTQHKNNNLKLWVSYKGKVLNTEYTLKLGGRCIYKIDTSYLRVVEFKGKKVVIYSFNIQDELKKINQLQFQLPLHTQQAVLDYHSCQVIFYNGKDDMFALLQFNNTGGKVSSYDTGNKIQNLSFYYKEYVIIGFKDQSIKALKIADMTYLKDQPQKKIKRTIEQPINNTNKQEGMMDQCEIKPSYNMMSMQE